MDRTLWNSLDTLLVFLTLMTVLVIPASGQGDQTGLLRVVVTDAAGGLLPGVSVEASWEDGSNPRRALTGPDGQAVLPALPPGLYHVTASLEGFQTARREGLSVRSGTSTRVPMTLELGAVEEVVTVVANRPLIETSTTELSTRLSAEDTELLPISRQATDLVKFTPGGSNSALWGGSTSQANSYKLDGVSVNQPGFGGDFLLPNVDWIEELQVRGLGAGAEYGNFQGGLINIVTKSGGNDLQGSLRFNLEEESLNASNLDLREAGFEDDRRLEVNAGLSGPLRKDRLYYFVSAQRVERDTNVVDVAASGEDQVAFLDTQEERTETKLLAKLTWQPSDSGLVTAVLGYDKVETDNRGLDSFTAPEAAETQDSPSTFFNLSWSDVLGAQHVFEVKLTGYEGDDDRLPRNGDQPAVQILGGDRETFENSVFTRLRSPESNALTAGLESYFQTGGVSHRLKVGAEIDEGTWSERRLRNGRFTWRPEFGDGPFDPNDASTWGFISSDWGSGIRLDAETTNAALYIQDYVDLSDRLRLSAGLRYGLWRGDLTPGFGGGSTFEAVDDEAFDPRLGAVFDFDGNGRWIGKVHWGRYHQSLFALLFDRALGGHVFQDVEFWDWVGPGLPDPNRIYTLDERDRLFELFDVVATGQEVGPVVDYEQPFVDQLVVSLEHALNDRFKLGLTYVQRENDNIVALVDRNLASNYTEFRNVQVIDFRSGDPVLDAMGQPLVLPRIFVGNDDILGRGWAPGLSDAQVASLTYDEDFVLTNADGASREMDQFQLTLDGRTDHFDLSASLVYTELEGDFFSVSGYSDPGGTGAGFLVRPNEGLNVFGALPGVSEWEAKLRLTAELPWKLRGGLYVQYTSGERYTPIYEIDNRNHDFLAENGEFFSFRHFSNVNGEDIFLEERGLRELDDATLVDVHLDRLFRIGDLDLVVGFDIFNLFNDDAVRDLQDVVNEQDPSDPTTLFGAPRRRTAPRATRLYASLRW